MARKDLKEVRKSLVGLSKNRSEKFKLELNKRVQLLRDNPCMCQKLENNEKLRRFFIQKYVIFYEIKRRQIIIKRVLPQKSNYNQKGIYKIKFPEKK